MEKIRTPFQGIKNIIKFNWHFFASSLFALSLLILAINYLSIEYHSVIYILIISISIPLLISLVISYYIYDASNLYELKHLDKIVTPTDRKLINIHAGFDETSLIIQQKFPNTTLDVFDFYDPKKHTEVSIRRARKAYPPFPNTKTITTTNIPLADECVDVIFLIFAAHEIRNRKERILFFNELNKILKPNGKVIVTEHLRDLPNFMAYTIGFFHFLSIKSWHDTFEKANFDIISKFKKTVFVTTFILKKNAITT